MVTIVSNNIVRVKPLPGHFLSVWHQCYFIYINWSVDSWGSQWWWNINMCVLLQWSCLTVCVIHDRQTSQLLQIYSSGWGQYDPKICTNLYIVLLQKELHLSSTTIFSDGWYLMLKLTPTNVFVCQFFIVDHIFAKYFIAMESSIVDILMLKFFILTITPHRKNYFCNPTPPLQGVKYSVWPITFCLSMLEQPKFYGDTLA